MGQALMENRHGLLGDFQVTTATGTAEREVVRTLGADKAYDTREFVQALRAQGVTPHIAQNTSGRRSAIDGRTTREPGYNASQNVRRRIEENPSAKIRPVQRLASRSGSPAILYRYRAPTRARRSGAPDRL